jgi:hypothetical protein
MDSIEVKRLVTDKTYQREISRAGSINVERIAEYFEWAKFSPVIVAPVEGGMFSIIDGQHRATAAMLRGIEKVPCEIVHIDRARQAEAFAAINGNTTRVSAQVVYYARLGRIQRLKKWHGFFRRQKLRSAEAQRPCV